MDMKLLEILPSSRERVFSGSCSQSFQQAADNGHTHILEIGVAECSAGEISEVFRLAFILL